MSLARPVLGGRRPAPARDQPGRAGRRRVEFVWTFAEILPPDLLDVFYPVGWDPRGVGMSRPTIQCGPADETGIPTRECVERTGDLLGFVGAADAALDLEEVRLALGVERLDYLGFSYGTALGAVYAMAHPDRVGRFVLDGAIDPSAGDPDNPLAPTACPTTRPTTRCGRRPLPRAVRRVDRVRRRPRQRRRDRQPPRHDPRPADGALRRRSRGAVGLDLDELIHGAMYDPWTWGLMATPCARGRR